MDKQRCDRCNAKVDSNTIDILKHLAWVLCDSCASGCEYIVAWHNDIPGFDFEERWEVGQLLQTYINDMRLKDKS